MKKSKIPNSGHLNKTVNKKKKKYFFYQILRCHYYFNSLAVQNAYKSLQPKCFPGINSNSGIIFKLASFYWAFFLFSSIFFSFILYFAPFYMSLFVSSILFLFSGETVVLLYLTIAQPIKVNNKKLVCFIYDFETHVLEWVLFIIVRANDSKHA